MFFAILSCGTIFCTHAASCQANNWRRLLCVFVELLSSTNQVLFVADLESFSYQSHPKLQSLPYLQQDGYSLLGLHLLASQCRKGIQEKSQGIYGLELIIAPLSVP